QLEEAYEIVGAPFACLVGLAEADLPARCEPAEERAALDREHHGPAGAEAALGPVWQPDDERPALDVWECALEEELRNALDAEGPRLGPECPIDRAHARNEPRPGTNAGLWWNGTPFRQSRSACQWM